MSMITVPGPHNVVTKATLSRRPLAPVVAVTMVTAAVVSSPGEEDALHHVEVLHEDVSVGLGGQVSHRVADAQLDGSLQSRGGGLGEGGGGEHRATSTTSPLLFCVPIGLCLHKLCFYKIYHWREN